MNLWKLAASAHTQILRCDVENYAEFKDPLASFQHVSSLLIKGECCHLQEFSDEDGEEDIDALMLAHSNAAGRRLSNAVSTVSELPTLNTAIKVRLCVLYDTVCVNTLHTHTLHHLTCETHC